jgi:hypothetical protein
MDLLNITIADSLRRPSEEIHRMAIKLETETRRDPRKHQHREHRETSTAPSS